MGEADKCSMLIGIRRKMLSTYVLRHVASKEDLLTHLPTSLLPIVGLPVFNFALEYAVTKPEENH
jgi:hypothetical protein